MEKLIVCLDFERDDLPVEYEDCLKQKISKDDLN